MPRHGTGVRCAQRLALPMGLNGPFLCGVRIDGTRVRCVSRRSQRPAGEGLFDLPRRRGRAAASFFMGGFPSGVTLSPGGRAAAISPRT